MLPQDMKAKIYFSYRESFKMIASHVYWIAFVRINNLMYNRIEALLKFPNDNKACKTTTYF